MNKFLGISFLSIFCSGSALAQERIDVPVRVEGRELVMPWSGGYNAPQFSNIDLNRDGIQDLISFDRQGDILRTYVRLPATGRWIMDLSYVDAFPPLVDWVMVADFDGDGVEDLFTSSSETGVPGVTVYKGAYENDTWSFSKLFDRGKAHLQVTAGAGLSNLYVSWEDIPAIVDVDGDGDIDILAFEPGGSFISFYANQSVENGWGRDSLRYRLMDICWGKILENELSETVYLSDSPSMCSNGNFSEEEYITPRHAGSTVMAMDIDYDGDLDAWLGDVSSRHLVFLLNGNTPAHAWMVDQDPHWPSEDVPVDLPFFVGAYSVQLDDDPEPEILAAINSRALTEDKVSVWRYDDDPFTDGPLTYSLTEEGFFQNEMIDVGSHSRPAVTDINGDGLPDLILGGYRYSEGSVTRIPSLWLFENQGSPAAPYFVLTDKDYLGMSQYATLPTFDFAPAFGDLDGNGTIDLVVGEQNGKLFFYKNKNLPDQPADFEAPVYPYMNIAVGVSATPQIADINGDGLADLIVGERTGNADQTGRCSNLNYFQNLGSTGQAIFMADPSMAPNTQCFGRVLFDIPIGLPQYSTPAVVRARDGWVLMTGTDHGRLQWYDQIQEGVSGSFRLLDGYFDGIDVGHRSAPALADINADGYYELIVGNQRGGLELFSTSIEVGTTSIGVPMKPEDKPYYFNGSLTDQATYVVWKNLQSGTVQVLDVSGRILPVETTVADGYSMIHLAGQAAGIYVVRITVGGKVWLEKVIKK